MSNFLARSNMPVDTAKNSMATATSMLISRPTPSSATRAYTGLTGGELGLRYFFFSKEMSQPWRIRPYISVAGGATHVDHIGDALYQSSNGFYSYAPFIKGRLYNDSWVGTGAFLVGAEVPLSCHWLVGLDAGIRYASP